MKKETSSLESRYNIIKENLGDQVNIMVSDISVLFPELEKSSLYWIISKLVKEGYNYFFSGIDVVIKFMQHVPEEYPIMLFAEKNSETDIIQLLKDNKITVVKASSVKAFDNEYVYTIMRPNVILYLTDNFDYADSNIALTEKAFIDLFYAITRNAYPMSLQELGKTYSNMIRLGGIDQKKMITISYKRNLQYDIRYIVENKYVSEGAKEIVKYI